jgi:hypothetical protein
MIGGKTYSVSHDTFSRAAIPGPTQLRRYGIVLVLSIAVTTIGILQLIKLVIRQRHHRRVPAATRPAVSGA